VSPAILSGLSIISPRVCPLTSSSSYFVTDSQLASPSWFWASPPSGAYDQIFNTVGHLQSSCCGAPSLMGWVCNLLVQFAVALWSKSHKTNNHILLPHLRLLGSFFVASYDLQDYSGGSTTTTTTTKSPPAVTSLPC
jgi:hypothetical protein